jgi:Fe-S-cluster containining protein
MLIKELKIDSNPCLSCGACCAFYRASFYWTEAEPALGGSVPVELTTRLNTHELCMKGTEGNHPCCVALQGKIGVRVKCDIYEKRSSTCHNFKVSWENGQPNERCDRARLAWGLAPLSPPHNINRPRRFRKAA